MRKIYFSRADTRAMALDHPIGDPIGGVAYGEKNDPISAVVSLATMGGTYAAAGSLAAMTVMQGITFAGAALSLVGNVTGNKTLSKIGMVAGVAGGLGSLAESAGLFKTPTLGSTFGGTAAPAAQTGASAAPLSQTPTAAPDTSTAAGAMARGATSPTAAMPVEGTGVVGGGATPGAAEAMAARTATSPAASQVAAPAASTVTQPAQSYAGANVADQATAGTSIWDKTKSAAKSVMEFTEKNPGGAVMLGNTASAVSDWLTGKTDAEIDELEKRKALYGAQAEQIQEAINNERRRRQNLNAGYENVDTGFNVNTGASMQQGLISGARQA